MFWFVVFVCVYAALAVGAVHAVAWWKRYLASDEERAAERAGLAIVALFVAGGLFEIAVRL